MRLLRALSNLVFRTMLNQKTVEIDVSYSVYGLQLVARIVSLCTATHLETELDISS